GAFPCLNTSAGDKTLRRLWQFLHEGAHALDAKSRWNILGEHAQFFHEYAGVVDRVHEIIERNIEDKQTSFAASVRKMCTTQRLDPVGSRGISGRERHDHVGASN